MNMSYICQIFVGLMIISSYKLPAAHKAPKSDPITELRGSLDRFSQSLGTLASKLKKLSKSSIQGLEEEGETKEPHDTSTPLEKYKNKKYQSGNWRVIGFYANTHAAGVGMEKNKLWQEAIEILSNNGKYGSAYFEGSHSFIQWLFPLFTKSEPNPDAPVLTDEIVNEFKEDPKLIEHLVQSFMVVVGGYYHINLIIEAGKTRAEDIVHSDIKGDAKGNTSGTTTTLIKIFQGHNNQRVTRILECMMAFGLKNYALAFFQCLQKVFVAAGGNLETSSGGPLQKSYGYWKHSIEYGPTKP